MYYTLMLDLSGYNSGDPKFIGILYISDNGYNSEYLIEIQILTV